MFPKIPSLGWTALAVAALLVTAAPPAFADNQVVFHFSGVSAAKAGDTARIDTNNAV